MAKMKPQLWCGKSPSDVLDLNNIMPVKNERWAKPYGRLWTSTFTPNEEYCSAWIEWCATEMPEWLSGNCYVLYPRADAKIYTIDTYQDLERLCRDYGYQTGGVFGIYVYPDWENVSKYFDAVHVTENGIYDTKFSRPCNLYGWDCESTLWFRNVFEKVVPISKVEHKCRLH